MSVRNNDVEFLNRLIWNMQIKMNVAQICRVTDISATDGSKVDAQPLAYNSSGSKRGLLLGVHVGRMLRDEIKVGDVVLVLFLDRSLENWDGSNHNFVLTSKRMHDVNDAFVIEVY